MRTRPTPSKGWLVLGIIMANIGVLSYPHYLLNQKGCVDKKLEVGFKMMGYPAYQETKKGTPIKVYRRGKPLLNGAEYKEGEALQVAIEGRSGQFCLEVRGAALFTDGQCDGKRVSTAAELGLPMGEDLQDVEIHAGIAGNEFSAVALARPFILRAPGTGSNYPPPEDDEDEDQSLTSGFVLGASVPRLEKTVVLDKDIGVEFSWTVGPNEGYVDMQIAGKGQAWVSATVIAGKAQMVTNPAHDVLVYPVADGQKVTYVSLMAQRSPGLLPKDYDPKEYEILLLESTTDYTLLRFRQHANEGTAILQPGGSNVLLYARGEGPYPAMHNSADVKTITWNADVGSAITKVGR